MNPYRRAASLVLKRLTWDVRIQSWLSRSALQKIKNCYSGEKAVILCNGPSLLNCDFSLLDKVYTFGLNKINLLFDQTTFRPDCIVAVNPFVIEQNKAFFQSISIPLFLDACSSSTAGLLSHPSAIFLHSAEFPSFSTDCSISIYQGFTVTYVAMQLAFHMGFSSVALIGCDHKFHVVGPANETRVALGDDYSHFHKDYFSAGQKWQLPDLVQSTISYLLAREVYIKEGRVLVNSTEGGCLEVLPRKTLLEFLNT